jgi:hypothetical protein
MGSELCGERDEIFNNNFGTFPYHLQGNMKNCSTTVADLIILNFSNDKPFTGFGHLICLDLSLTEICLPQWLPRMCHHPRSMENFLVLVAPTHDRPIVYAINPETVEQ